MAKQTLNEAGEWRDGAAAPKLLPEELRVLPGELVGNDVDDPDKAHELDAPHVVGSIVRDHAKAIEAAEKPAKETTRTVAKKLWAPGPGERAPVRQWFVDVTKMRVIAAMAAAALDDFNAGRVPDIGVHHLWFPTDNVNAYELRRGNPPHRKDRPRHMRDIDLVVDVMAPPRSILAELKKKGVEFDLKKALQRERDAQRAIVSF